jgi:hypothetical protein
MSCSEMSNFSWCSEMSGHNSENCYLTNLPDQQIVKVTSYVLIDWFDGNKTK